MPRKKHSAAPVVLQPDVFYRKHVAIENGLTGYGATQTDEAIKRGDLPPLVKLGRDARACGWYGSQLIEVRERRLAEAERGAVR